MLGMGDGGTVDHGLAWRQAGGRSQGAKCGSRSPVWGELLYFGRQFVEGATRHDRPRRR
jgi:hypothetical protein